MTNPFTRFLSQWSADKQIQEFVAHWDVLELVVVQVYRQKMTPAAAQHEFDHTWPWLRQQYDRWDPVLRPFWQQTQAAGARTQTDPFRLLLALTQPEDIIGNWRAMQHLPAAREALNQYLRYLNQSLTPS